MSAPRLPSMPAANIRNVYSSTNVTTSAYVQLVASLGSEIVMAHISDTSGATLVLAIGPAGGEVNILNISPNMDINVPLHLSTRTRISVKALSGTANTGELNITLFA